MTTEEVIITEDQSIWRSEREQYVINLLFESIKADDKERVANLIDGSRTMKSLMARKVILISRPPK